ncbi:MAG TPA: type IIL restriction-modification enzyme MmeI, partial [Acetobacteraceae bacterium]|nr:type IIL restriction-modification enzyme MmeI [Acetobacteraceae bacterium]
MTGEAGIEAFISRWQGREGGQERANYGMFLSELCAAIGVPAPDPAAATTSENDYVLERAVKLRGPDGTASNGRIDLYKRGCFVLEAKQSRETRGKPKFVETHERQMPPPPDARPVARGRRGAGRSWDVLLQNARNQAETYAKALPADHGWPPFILVCDVGHVIEVFADFSGQGKNYVQFPDRNHFRVYLEDLRQPDIVDRLRRIWTDPLSLDPARHAARVTRDI